MNLKQLRTFKAIVDHDFNMSSAADTLHITQPGVSKQIKLLEDELSIHVFRRSGKQLIGLSAAGEAILQQIEAIVHETDNIYRIANEFRQEDKGTLRLATTHTQAKYILPRILHQFREKYPKVRVELQQGAPLEVATMAAKGEVDFAIATESLSRFEALLVMPIYQWNRTVVLPKGHPLADRPLSLEAIVDYPIITYMQGFTGRRLIDQTFAQAGLMPNIILSAVDSDIIKTYVREGMGIGIIAQMAYDGQVDDDLVVLDVEHLFPWSTSSVAFRQGHFLRKYMYAFIELLAPHLTKSTIESIIKHKKPGQTQPDVSLDTLPRY